MKCHDILGITEWATEDAILSSYAKHIENIAEIEKTNFALWEKKYQELNSAKEECLLWKSRSVFSRASCKMFEFSSNASASNRTNACCIGPFSLCDWGCGGICCGNMWSHDKGCVNAVCFNDTISYIPTIWCDIVAYICAIFSIVKLDRSSPTPPNVPSSVFSSPEFKSAVAQTASIYRCFINAVNKKGGSVELVLHQGDDVSYAFDSFVTFHVRLEHGYSAYIDLIRSNQYSAADEEKFLDLYSKETFGKTNRELLDLGIVAGIIIDNIVRGADDCEGIFNYNIICPCDISGKQRERFIDEVKKVVSSSEA